MKKIGVFLLLFFAGTVLSAQHLITGSFYNNENGQPIADVQVAIKGTTIGTTSDLHGNFSLTTDLDKLTLTFRHVGYKYQEINMTNQSSTLDMGSMALVPLSVKLDEITITEGLVNHDNTPITISTIGSAEIRTQLGEQPLPLLMNGIPGIYSTRTGGGSGDAQMSIRGFNQENIGILLNGIPIGSVENGLVYWNNWLGLSHAMAEIQIQKGPGVSNVAINSVGGSVNIVTSSPQETPDYSVSYQVSSYGNQEISFSVNSGRMQNGWNVAFCGSHLTGSGYIDATSVNSWSYFLALNKQLTDKSKITITLLGTPDVHNQRNFTLTNAEHEYFGNKYNKDWGGLNGEQKTASQNFYHKPFLSVNHYYSVNSHTIWANAVYASVGYGGGIWSESFNYAPSIFEYRTSSGQIDWPTIYNQNAENTGNYVLENGDTITGYSLNVGTSYLASHWQTGWMSTLRHQVNDRLTLTAGIHYRYFNSLVREKITDLMGGKVFIDDYGWAVDGVSGRPQLRYVGDIIKVNNSSIVNFTSVYAQATYNNGRVNAYFSVGGNNNWYQRIDRYNYVNNQRSEVITKPGFDTRGGISLALGRNHEIYGNTAYISRAPYYKYVFGNYTNVPVHDLKNEHISTVEIGYRFKSRVLSAEVNAYYTDWGNVSMLSNEYIQLEDNTQTRAMINGLHSTHQGIETTVGIRIGENINLGLMGATGDYEWKNDIQATLLNNDNVVIDTIMVMAKGLKVGGMAQQQVGAQFSTKLLKMFDIKMEWIYYDKFFASFDPVIRTNPNDRQQPWQSPGFHTVNIYASMHTKLFNTPCLVQLNTYNLLNDIHVVYAEDGSDHTVETMHGFWSFGHTFDVMLKINL